MVLWDSSGAGSTGSQCERRDSRMRGVVCVDGTKVSEDTFCSIRAIKSGVVEVMCNGIECECIHDRRFHAQLKMILI